MYLLPVALTDFFIGELGSDPYEWQICLVDGYKLHTIGLVQVYYLMSDIYLGTEDKLFAYIFLADQRLGGEAVLKGLRNNDLFEIFDEHYSRDLQTVKQFDANSLEKLPQGSCSRSAIRGYLGVLKMFYHETLRAIGQEAIKPSQVRQLGKVDDSIIHLYDLLGAEAESDPSWLYFKCRKDHRDIQNARIKSGPGFLFLCLTRATTSCSGIISLEIEMNNQSIINDYGDPMFKQLSALIKTINVYGKHRGEISILVTPSGSSFRICCRKDKQTEAEPVSRWFDSEEMYNAIVYLTENYAINKNENQGI